MKYNIKNTSGQFYVKGRGLISVPQSQATQIEGNEVTSVIGCLTNAGFSGLSYVQAVKSFAVCYVRGGDLAANGSVKPNALNPSRRRFATRAEANTHGARFAERKAKGSTVVGSAGHVGFYVIESSDAVNAYINTATGLTNSI